MPVVKGTFLSNGKGLILPSPAPENQDTLARRGGCYGWMTDSETWPERARDLDVVTVQLEHG